MKIKVSNVNIPNWKEVTVKSRIPVELEKLSEIARNIWWAWNFEATELFRDLDPELWKECGQNPVLLLERMSYEKLEALTKDKVILRRMNEVYTKFRDYMDVKPDSQRPSVAYFSMEYGLSSVLKIYSGGLGVLAGDYLKEASDSNVDLCAVGFLYRYGYFTQTLSMDGQQIANYEAQNFGQLPIDRVLDADGKPLVVDVPYLDYYVHANVWRVNVGRISLYLLDTDNEMNSEFDRPITHQLYGGDWENRLKQEILLGIGGILTLKALGIKKDIYHCNEGHAALINVQRICDYVATGLTFNQAIELVRASSLYTVHTPVPAGHDYFDEGLFGKYMGGYPAKMGITWDDLMDLGRNNAGDKGERFCMSVFACNTSQEVNGVSWLHGKVSQEMFSSIWKGYFPEESHVGYVTNGVHFPTWSATEWKKLYFKYFNENFWFDQSNPKIWEAIYNVPDEEIWQTRMTMKNKLVDYIRKSFRDTWLKNQGDPSRIVSLMDKINPNALLIGFGRRFATYKRAHLLFTDLERLSKIVNNPDYPVQFLFTGKAHPHDGAGQGLIKRIIEISRRPEFLGKIIFLENYDMQLARRLVSGVDIWLNTPTRPLEASGTSGEKALMNGVVNFSVLDGWWLEGYREGAGWALTEKRTYQNQEHQDQLDAATIYSILETEILPLYYARNKKGYSEGWIKVVKNSIAQIAPHYTMKRQLDDYYSKFYCKQAKRFHALAANDNAKAKEIAAWKEEVVAKWDSIEIVSCDKVEELKKGDIESGKEYTITYVIDEKGLNDAVGLELVTTYTTADGKQHVYSVEPFNVIKKEGDLYTFQVKHSLSNAGSFKVSYRMFPKNPELPHRQDFCYVRWFV
ncbi:MULTISPECIES: glycosyltransferase family 1 protein [Bacteroides]|jgi:starch phosphorylase|uniref:Glycosyltransferase family 1 protein n=3 Tax=Bacteroides finegoldii TaxID=338188 RepID=A0A7J4YM79_9BACE|nr:MULTISPECIES: glycosyltransferase family 1 protein [Bacteroides]EEX45684.1 alpha-glucan phosphorylase [Bacteroides finegoldii DSM 17565]KAA5216162.1 glycosyltransferase family 1 protein [Bacteroides finegoldii]KAA5220341.1 glycosyltransferase family 1 protein [Bacteroides finegoldii]KAA5224761.1 glycosyltransferase family 1 protein [Bacteroides finegoldii]KAA5229377.1 glycosyltransferase family 1 protein [Bacteroides finegoldii]